ncbi:MAG: hypothetical protein DMF62_02430 [Acidobacteria bacterium]|nr:MAG: hypothetical protein DMF62_02430 [Acidobacteriota bacterium]
MSVGVPLRLANGVGNFPDANKWMTDYDYLTALIHGNFLQNAGMETWNSATTFTNPAHGATVADSWVVLKTGTSGATVDVTRESTTKDTGTYSMKVNVTGAGSADSVWDVHQAVTAPTRFASETVLFGARVYSAAANKIRLKVSDGITDAYSTYHTGNSTWQSLYVPLSVSASVAALTVTVEANNSDFTGAFYIDSLFLYAVPAQITSDAKAALGYLSLFAGFVQAIGGTMTGSLLLPDGTAGAPSLSFSADSDNGPYRIGTNNWGLSVGGTKRVDLSTTAMTLAVALAMGSNKITGLAAGTTSGDALRYEQLVGVYLALAGGTMAGNIAMGSNKLTGLAAGSGAGDSIRYEQLVGAYLALTGGTMAGNIAMGTNKLTGLAAGSAAGDSVRFEQLKIIQVVTATTDTAFATTSSTFQTTNLSTSITPTSTSNKILAIVTGDAEVTGNTTVFYFSIFRGSTDLSAGNGLNSCQPGSGAGLFRFPIHMSILDSPASVSSLTYSCKIRNANNAATVNFPSSATNGTPRGTIILLEVA